MNDYERIEQAIQFIETHRETQPSLEGVAFAIGVSPSHCQKLFKRWAGLSPKQFCQYLTLEHARALLRDSHTLLDTSLSVGLSGSSRLHDLFVTFDAMTPGEYAAEGAGLEIEYGYHETPFGECFIALTKRGICRFEFVGAGERQEARARLQAAWSRSALREDSQTTAQTVKELFRLPRSNKPFHLLLRGTNFQVKIWEALLHIPSGALTTYSAVAARAGKPRAIRAAASAVGDNPIAYLIPCHRVIRKSGSINQYRWGSARKRAMIVWEQGINEAMEGREGK